MKKYILICGAFFLASYILNAQADMDSTALPEFPGMHSNAVKIIKSDGTDFCLSQCDTGYLVPNKNGKNCMAFVPSDKSSAGNHVTADGIKTVIIGSGGSNSLDVTYTYTPSTAYEDNVVIQCHIFKTENGTCASLGDETLFYFRVLMYKEFALPMFVPKRYGDNDPSANDGNTCALENPSYSALNLDFNFIQGSDIQAGVGYQNTYKLEEEMQ